MFARPAVQVQRPVQSGYAAVRYSPPNKTSSSGLLRRAQQAEIQKDAALIRPRGAHRE
jgi:hypothetical protein